MYEVYRMYDIKLNLPSVCSYNLKRKLSGLAFVSQLEYNELGAAGGNFARTHARTHENTYALVQHARTHSLMQAHTTRTHACTRANMLACTLMRMAAEVKRSQWLANYTCRTFFGT